MPPVGPLMPTTIARKDRCLGELDRRRGLSPEAFWREYHEPRKPVVLQGLMDDWRALREWSIPWFREHCAGDRVPVASLNCQVLAPSFQPGAEPPGDRPGGT